MAGGGSHRETALHGAAHRWLPCAAAIAVSTALVCFVALFNVDEVSVTALTMQAFELGASVFFLAAGILRLGRWRVTTDPHSALLAAAMFVLGLLSLPLGNLTGQLFLDHLEPQVALAVRALGTVACLALALRAMTVADDAAPVEWTRTLLVAGVVAALGILGLVVLFTIAATQLTASVLLHVAVNLVLGASWIALGLAASRRDGKQPWAGRVAPLYASLGVVELLHALDQVQHGSWSMAGAALISSVAMITAHASYVDLAEAVRMAARVDLGTHGLRGDAAAELLGSGSSEPRCDLDVTSLLTMLAGRRAGVGQEVRVRGGSGYAYARPRDVAAALEKLLDNAHTYASGSPVTVHVVAIGPRVEVTVTDRGPGMSAAAASAFGSAEAGRGSGLGLHVARALMARNGGDLELRNRIGGTTFVLTLPAASDQRTPPVIPAWDATGLHAKA